MNAVVKRTFLTFQGLGENKEAVYEVAIGLAEKNYVVTCTEDILENGIPLSTKTEIPPYIRRDEETLEKALRFYNAYISDLQATRPKKGWMLVNLVEKSK